MAKKITGYIKLQIKAGAATPAPPVGPALGQHGVNIMEFCKQYNAATEAQRGDIVPVEISVFEDRSFTFITKTPPAARMILKAAGGVFVSNVNERSAKTVMTTGTLRSGSICAVFALKALQNSMMLTPCWPSAGPMGGAGFAFPAGT